MSTGTPPISTETLVQNLIAADSAAHQRVLIARARLDREGASEAARLLVGEAERLWGVDLLRMERLCLTAQELARQAGDDFQWAMARFKHGESLEARGRNAEACALLDEAAAVFTRIGCPVEAARTRIGWCSAKAKLGDDRGALAGARAARRVLVAHGATLRVAVLDFHIGVIHFDRGRLRTALRWYGSALKFYESIGDTVRVGNARHSRALVLSRQGRYREALAELEQARDMLRLVGGRTLEVIVTRSIGELHMNLGRSALALQAFEEARALFRSLGNHAGAVWSARDMADCYLHLNRAVEALEVLAAARADLEHDDRVADAYAIAVRCIAAYLALEDRAGALAALDDTERRFPDDIAHHRPWLMLQRAAALLREDEPASALTSARAARALSRASGMRRSTADAALVESAALADLGQIDDAERAARYSARVARGLDAAPLLYRAYERLGQIAEARQQPAVAGRRYMRAIEHLEREQRSVIFEFRDSFATDRGTAYERLAALQLKSGRAGDALATAERAKSRALADAISGYVELRPRGSATARRLARELADLRARYAATFTRANREGQQSGSDGEPYGPDELTALEARIHELVRRLQVAGADSDADLYGAVPDASPPFLPEDTGLIEYFFSGDDILRFVVDGAGVHGNTLTGAVPEVERLLRIFRVNLDAATKTAPERQGRLTTQARAVLGRLYERLLGGLDGLDRFRALVIVPHGLLHYLPFHALHDGERYLVERFAVSYAPSAALYGICRARAASTTRRRRALVLAHSAGGRMPHTLDEAAAVGTVLGVPVHSETGATRALLARDGRRAGVIHIAAHGQFRADAPLFSHVELADGPLTSADVFDLKLGNAFVSLSACETGRAVLGGGDELAGLARAFLYAGASGMLVSQWRVEDASTAALMTHLYQSLADQRGGARPAQALQAAQVACLRAEDLPGGSTSHPFYWAGFQIVGS